MNNSDYSGAVLESKELGSLSPADLKGYFKPCLDALELPAVSLKIKRRKFPAPPNHIVYFIRGAGGAIKIGFTQQPLKGRLKCIQNGSPVRLVVLATRNASQECERFYHRRFAAHRLHGEWFAPHPDILAEIDRLNAGPETGVASRPGPTTTMR